MAITSSAKKAIRASARKRMFNLRRKEALYDASKAVKKALAAKDGAAAEKLLPEAFSAIDKARKRGVIKDNTADRKKARLAAAVRRIQA
jgi:small subunit ribosomal protein S20